MPALVIEPFKLSMPTSPGQVPLQFATVRMGPRWVNSPAERDGGYCQTAFGDDQAALRDQLAKYFHPHLLRIDKAVLLSAVEWMRANDFPAFGFESPGERRSPFGLFRPAFLVGGKPEIAIGHQIDVFGFKTLHIPAETRFQRDWYNTSGWVVPLKDCGNQLSFSRAEEEIGVCGNMEIERIDEVIRSLGAV